MTGGVDNLMKLLIIVIIAVFILAVRGICAWFMSRQQGQFVVRGKALRRTCSGSPSSSDVTANFSRI